MSSLSLDGQAAARALLAVLRAVDAADADERFFESLVLNALQQIPDLPGALLGCGRDVVFDRGRQGFADIVGWRDEAVVVQVEVKVRAQINKWDTPDNQLDRYAAATPQADLFLITTKNHYTRRASQFAATSSLPRWRMLWLPDLADTLNQTVGMLPADGSAERLARSLARLS